MCSSPATYNSVCDVQGVCLMVLACTEPVCWGAQGGDWNGQVKLGNNEFYGLNYLQSVTPTLALGGEAFWLGQQRKSGAGFAARHADASHVATCQVATTGLVSLTYLQKVSEKVRGRMRYPGARMS